MPATEAFSKAWPMQSLQWIHLQITDGNFFITAVKSIFTRLAPLNLLHCPKSKEDFQVITRCKGGKILRRGKFPNVNFIATFWKFTEKFGKGRKKLSCFELANSRFKIYKYTHFTTAADNKYRELQPYS
jgi:hypothetical protein